MSHRPARLLLDDILERIDRIDRYVADVDRETFLRDGKTSDSVVRNLEVIGEAASRLPEQFRARHAEVPWRRIVGLRNRIIHEYFDVDLELVWEILQTELPGLKAGLRGLLTDAGSDQDMGI
jgi:uncharacterized protein with HEPN domain